MNGTFKLIALASVLGILAGCADDSIPRSRLESDQCLRAALFKSCLQILPAGPISAKYNDWSEVVDECESAAYRQSLRKEGVTKRECAV